MRDDVERSRMGNRRRRETIGNAKSDLIESGERRCVLDDDYWDVDVAFGLVCGSDDGNYICEVFTSREEGTRVADRAVDGEELVADLGARRIKMEVDGAIVGMREVENKASADL
jgi:hypothetical protein